MIVLYFVVIAYNDRKHHHKCYFLITNIFLFADCAHNVQISDVSNGSTVAAGSVLRCSAEGRPPPTYQWTAVTGVVTETGPTVAVQRADTYYVLTCTASNTITHADATTEECSSSSTVYFNS